MLNNAGFKVQDKKLLLPLRQSLQNYACRIGNNVLGVDWSSSMSIKKDAGMDVSVKNDLRVPVTRS